MRSSVATVVAVAASLVFVACSNDTNPARIVAPSARSADLIPPSCDPQTISQDGGKYFSSKKDPVFDAIATLKSDLKTYGVGAQTTADVFSILKRVSLVRLTSAASDAATGATFVDDVLACVNFGVPAKFNASASLGSGIFSVSPAATAAVEAFASSSAVTPSLRRHVGALSRSPGTPGRPARPTSSSAIRWETRSPRLASSSAPCRRGS